MNTCPPVAVRPFLKWAGNKFRLIGRIKAMLPPGRRLIEPFVGSGALFLNSDYPGYLLADSNQDLIHLYLQLKEEGPAFIRHSRSFFKEENNSAERYYELRDRFNGCRQRRQRAALFLYLNRHGYNGLCRYNSSGGFNVPFGSFKRPYFPEKEMLAFHERAQHAEFRTADFQTVMSEAQPGDVIYCDPPYVPLSTTANFTAYSAGGFDLEAQRRLAKLAAEAAERGIPVLISNHRTHLTDEIYSAAARDHFEVQRFISCDGSGRGKAEEVLALFAA